MITQPILEKVLALNDAVKRTRAGKKPTKAQEQLLELLDENRKLGIVNTLVAASSKTGLSIAIIQAAKAAGCSAFTASGRIDCDKLKEFAEKMPVDPDAVNFYDEKALNVQADRRLKEQKLLERQKLVWPIEKIRAAWTRNVIAAKSKMQAAENSIAVEAALRLNFTADQITVIREIVTKHHRAAQRELYIGEWGRVVCPSCKKELLP